MAIVFRRCADRARLRHRDHDQGGHDRRAEEDLNALVAYLTASSHQ
jgi:hypothetical protein